MLRAVGEGLRTSPSRRSVVVGLLHAWDASREETCLLCKLCKLHLGVRVSDGTHHTPPLCASCPAGGSTSPPPWRTRVVTSNTCCAPCAMEVWWCRVEGVLASHVLPVMCLSVVARMVLQHLAVRWDVPFPHVCACCWAEPARRSTQPGFSACCLAGCRLMWDSMCVFVSVGLVSVALLSRALVGVWSVHVCFQGRSCCPLAALSPPWGWPGRGTHALAWCTLLAACLGPTLPCLVHGLTAPFLCDAALLADQVMVQQVCTVYSRRGVRFACHVCCGGPHQTHHWLCRIDSGHW